MRKAARNLTIFRHGSHAEWGHGIIVEENSSKLYLYFENGGRRAFVNDDRYRQLLVRAELSSEDAAALRAKLEKFVPSPKKAASKKKAPSRSSAGHPAA
jgi:hypothetical protein